MAIRQPIVSILGHVDHGKTTLLDCIRGTTVAAREAGFITQHIGATEVPADTIFSLCGRLGARNTVKIPGLLFIDTPGHHSFTTLRTRGGSLADLAVLVVDINEGFKPQTIESMQILRRHKTPFLVAANKIDAISGFQRSDKTCYIDAIPGQPQWYQDALEAKMYDLIGQFSQQGFSADLFSRISDFKTSLAIVPVSAKHHTGIPELLMVLIGLAQNFLSDTLLTEEGPGEGTILEVKEDKGLGVTLDTIIYKGEIRRGDTVVVGAKPRPAVAKVRALLKPKPLDEIRDPREQFDSVAQVTAAAGIKITGQGFDGAIAGSPIRVVRGDPEPVIAEIEKELKISFETVDEGIVVKADAIGSLEAMAFEAKNAGIPIKLASVGPVSKRDVVEAATIQNEEYKVILAFNVPVAPEAAEEARTSCVGLIHGDIIYGIIGEYQKWSASKKCELDKADRKEVMYPGKVLVLPDCVFRISKPAIVGVRVLAGRIRQGQRLIRDDGKEVGHIRSIRVDEETLQEAIQGKEVAIAVEGATVGRQFRIEDILMVDVPEGDARTLYKSERLSFDDREALDHLFKVKRKADNFWGR